MGIARAEMGFNRFVQNGRVCLVNYGPHVDKLVTVVDVLDGERVLVTSPTVARQIVGIKRLSLTDIKIAISRGARKKTVEKAWAEAGVEGQWPSSSWGKKMAKRAAKVAHIVVFREPNLGESLL